MTVSAEVTVRLDLKALGLRHAEGSDCPCGGTDHEAVVEIYLDENGLHHEEDCREDVLEAEGVLQALHEQAHPGGAVFAESCWERGCLEANQIGPR
jgi:hypothetical protein